MGQDDSDKTEEPTEHKLQEARKKGQVFKSQDIIQTALLLFTSGVLYMERNFLLQSMASFTRWSYNLINADLNLPERNIQGDFIFATITMLQVLAPLFAIGLSLIHI